MIQFLLNDTAIEVETCSPTLTILDWLRTINGKVGTKEGCATGDCGACTLLVGEECIDADGSKKWQYKTINSCLMLLGNAHGKHIITVEAVTISKYPKLQDLHPVQRAMVECHGSQCGFCTPGFIMSLLALYINNETYPGKSAVLHALGGNLCRCTGYSPIIKAAEKAYEYERSQEPWSTMAAQFKQGLSNKQNKTNKDNNEVPFLKSDSRVFYLPQFTDQLVNLRAKYPDSQLVSGGTDFSIELSQNLILPDVIISTSQVQELTQFTDTQTCFAIGAAVTYHQLMDKFCAEFPESKELFERLGSSQIRNSGTLGGSLGNASPIGDPAPLLIALNASMVLVSNEGSRTIKVQDFFVGYRQTVLKTNEVISQVLVPKRSDSLKLACHKISKRFEDDISTVCLVLAIEHEQGVITQARCAMGGMAAIPARAKQVEQQLVGAKMETRSITHAATFINQDFSPMSDVRASKEYRLLVSQNLMQRIAHEFEQSIPITNITSLPKVRIAHASL